MFCKAWWIAVLAVLLPVSAHAEWVQLHQVGGSGNNWAAISAGTPLNAVAVGVKSLTGNSEPAIVRTIDGKTWTDVPSPGPLALIISLDMPDENTVYGGGLGMYKSKDGGGSFSEVKLPATGGPFSLTTVSRVHAVDANHVWALSEDKIFWTPNGMQWEASEPGMKVTYSGISFIDSQDGWVAGGGREEVTETDPWTQEEKVVGYNYLAQGIVMRTKDGGKTFEPLVVASKDYYQAIVFLNETVGLAVASNNDSPWFIKRTTDGGKKWTDIDLPGAPADMEWLNLSRIVVMSPMEMRAAGCVGWPDSEIDNLGNKAVVLRSQDGGTSWDYEAEAEGQGCYFDIDFPGPHWGFVAGTFGKIYGYTDGTEWVEPVEPDVVGPDEDATVYPDGQGPAEDAFTWGSVFGTFGDDVLISQASYPGGDGGLVIPGEEDGGCATQTRTSGGCAASPVPTTTGAALAALLLAVLLAARRAVPARGSASEAERGKDRPNPQGIRHPERSRPPCLDARGPSRNNQIEFGRRCIPSDFVALPRHTSGMPRHRSLPAGRLDALGSSGYFVAGPGHRSSAVERRISCCLGTSLLLAVAASCSGTDEAVTTCKDAAVATYDFGPGPDAAPQDVQSDAAVPQGWSCGLSEGEAPFDLGSAGGRVADVNDAIVFVKVREDGGSDLYLVSPDGKQSRALTRFEHKDVHVFSPAWSPDRKHVVFVSDYRWLYNKERQNVFVVSSDGSRCYQVTPGVEAARIAGDAQLTGTVTGTFKFGQGAIAAPVPLALVGFPGGSELALTGEGGEFSLKVRPGTGTIVLRGLVNDMTVAVLGVAGYEVEAGQTMDVGAVIGFVEATSTVGPLFWSDAGDRIYAYVNAEIRYLASIDSATGESAPYLEKEDDRVAVFVPFPTGNRAVAAYNSSPEDYKVLGLGDEPEVLHELKFPGQTGDSFVAMSPMQLLATLQGDKLVLLGADSAGDLSFQELAPGGLVGLAADQLDWSLSGTRLVATLVSGTSSNLVVMDANTRKAVAITTDGRSSMPAWYGR